MAIRDGAGLREEDLPAVLQDVAAVPGTASLDLGAVQRRARRIELRRRLAVGTAALVCLSGLAGVYTIAQAVPARPRPVTSAAQCSWPPPDRKLPITDGQVLPPLGMPPPTETIEQVEEYARQYPDEAGRISIFYNRPYGIAYIGFTGRECFHLEHLRARVADPDSVRVFTVVNSFASASRLSERIVRDMPRLAAAGITINTVGVDATSAAVNVTVSRDADFARDQLVQRYSPDAPSHLHVYIGGPIEFWGWSLTPR